jgi:peptidoglycan hydrolase-like protein with peptidoglycan-binding domain
VTDAPAAARESIRWLYDQAVARAGHSLRKMGHRDGKSTACPGDELYAWVRAGMPAASADGSPAVQVPDAPTPPAPPFPLPPGHYYGPRSGPARSVSGFYQRPGHPWRLGLQRWQRRMVARGWSLPSGADGLYGDETARVAEAFQAEKGLHRDALIGPETWAAAWTAPVTR